MCSARSAELVRIVGPQGSGKGLLHNVLAASRLKPGSFAMQSFPCTRPRVAERYILAFRAEAATSIQRHKYLTHTIVGARAIVEDAWLQVWAHIGDAPHVVVDYRDVVDDLPAVIVELAEFLDIPVWSYDGQIFDGDAVHG